MYTTQGKIENMFGITMTAAQAAAIIDIIAATKIFIDRYVGKTFEAVNEARYFDWNGHTKIVIDTFVGTPSLVQFLNSDGTVARTLTVGADQDYITIPYTNASDASAERNTLMLTNKGWGGSTGWWYAGLPTGTRALKVTAHFGFSDTVPADIQFAATKIAGQMLQDTNEGIITQIRLGDYQATFATMDENTEALGVNNVLDSYRDIDI